MTQIVEAALVYAGAAAAATVMAAAQSVVAPGAVEPDLFLPSCLGAGIAALRTILPAISKKSAEPPSAVYLRAFISLTAGFGVGFYGTHDILSLFGEQVRPSPAFSAMCIAALGEFGLAVVTERIQKGAGKGGSK